MTDLERIKAWISTYPATTALQSLVIDYYAPQGDKEISPAGLMELSRTESVTGAVTVENRYSFGLYYTLSAGTQEEADANTQWVLGFQNWIQQQGITKQAPVFGDEGETERIYAHGGSRYAVSEDGITTYLLQLTIDFKKIY